MTKNELAAMLGMKPTETKSRAAKSKTPLLTTSPGTPAHQPAIPSSETALVLDQWDRKQGETVLNNSLDLTQAGLTPAETADLFGSAFLSEPTLAEGGPATQSNFIKKLLDTPEFQSLRTSTIYNELASEIAANEFGKQYAQMKIATEKHDKANPGKGEGTPEGDKARDTEANKAIAKAMGRAEQEIEALEEAMAACGHGKGGKVAGRTAKDIGKAFQRIKNSARLRAIFAAAGRYRRLAQAKQRQKTGHGFDEFTGVEPSGDLGRVLPLELACLADEDLELDALRRLAERQAMSRAFRAIEPIGQGPIIVTVDESGSMASNKKVDQAKAFALAMAWIARHQKRWCALVGYSGGAKPNILVLKPGHWNDADILDWCEHFHGGGSDLDVPLDTTLFTTLGAPKGKTDMFIISDGICNIPAHTVEQFNAWRVAEKVKVSSLVINNAGEGSYNDSQLRKVSDEVHFTSHLSADCEFVDKALAV